MTEYELVALHQGQGNLVGAIVMNYFTVVTAYLVAGYLVAHRLTLAMTVLVTVLFTFAAAYLTFNAYGITRNLMMIAAEIRTFAEAGRGLAWHNGAALPPWAGDAYIGMTVAIMAVGIAAAISFFFHCRRVNRKAELETTQPKGLT